ncbi:MAG: WxcM-like domain-containing protein [Bacteroidales bacterium]|nr:WxcM-like domain-containing protein [Bacteroidales bacterium]
MKQNTVYNCSVIELPKIHNRAGNITPLQSNIEAPFDIKRIYYLYDVPGGEGRGGHAHKELQQFLVAASGSFDVIIDDGRTKRTIHLCRPYIALHIVPGIWRDLTNFSSGSICLVLASLNYDEKDYIRDYTKFSLLKNE